MISGSGSASRLNPEACDLDRDRSERCEPVADPREPDRDLREAGVPDRERDPLRERCEPDQAEAGVPERFLFWEVSERLLFWSVSEPDHCLTGELDRESWCSREKPGVGATAGVPLRLRLPRLESESEPIRR